MPNRGQANKNDERSQGRDEMQDVQGEVEGGTATAENSVDQLTQAVQGLRQRRIAAVNEVGTIDQRLVELREEISAMIEGSGNVVAQPPTRVDRATSRTGGRGRTVRNTGTQKRARGGRRSANGQSGTAIIEEILREHKGRMESGECAKLAEERGVKWPHSSFQSLKKRGRIALKDGFVEFTDVE